MKKKSGYVTTINNSQNAASLRGFPSHIAYARPWRSEVAEASTEPCSKTFFKVSKGLSRYIKLFYERANCPVGHSPVEPLKDKELL